MVIKGSCPRARDSVWLVIDVHCYTITHRDTPNPLFRPLQPHLPCLSCRDCCVHGDNICSQTSTCCTFACGSLWLMLEKTYSHLNNLCCDSQNNVWVEDAISWIFHVLPYLLRIKLSASHVQEQFSSFLAQSTFLTALPWLECFVSSPTPNSNILQHKRMKRTVKRALDGIMWGPKGIHYLTRTYHIHVSICAPYRIHIAFKLCGETSFITEIKLLKVKTSAWMLSLGVQRLVQVHQEKTHKE